MGIDEIHNGFFNVVQLIQRTPTSLFRQGSRKGGKGNEGGLREVYVDNITTYFKVSRERTAVCEESKLLETALEESENDRKRSIGV